MEENKKLPNAFEKRIHYVLKTYSEKLWEKFSSQEQEWHDVTDIQSLTATLASADPTSSGKSLRWIVETYLRGGLRLEDLERTRTTLDLFYKNHSRLPKEKKDLLSYKSEADLWSAVESFSNAPVLISGKAQDRADRQKAYDESTILYNSPEGIVVILKTEFAAQWWGRGTRWCTASEGSRIFKYYNDKGPIVVIVLNNGEKFQAHAYTKQFANSGDRRINIKDFLNAHPWMKDIRILNLSFIQIDPDLVKNYLSTPEDRKLVLKVNPELIKYFIDTATSEERMIAISSNSDLIKHFIDTATPEERITAIRKNSDSIQYFLNDATSEERITALRNNGHSIQYFIETATPQERLCAIKNHARSIQYFIKSATYRERIEAIKKDSSCIKYFIDTATSEEKIAALRKDSSLLKLFLDKSTLEERLAAISHDAHCIRNFINIATPEERMAAIKRDSDSVLYFIHDLTPEEKEASINNKSNFILHLPKKYKKDKISNLNKYTTNIGISISAILHSLKTKSANLFK